MRYQSILGNCNETTIGGLINQCPQTSAVFQSLSLDVNKDLDKTVQEAAAKAGVPGKTLCRELFDVCMEHKPLEEMETDTLIELLNTDYYAVHLEQLPALHRLARKIEAVHRATPGVPLGITRTVKQIEQILINHIEHQKDPKRSCLQHELLKLQLRGLRELTGQYKAPEAACRSWRRLYDELKSLDFSLSEQIYLERDILSPRFKA